MFGMRNVLSVFGLAAVTACATPPNDTPADSSATPKTITTVPKSDPYEALGFKKTIGQDGCSYYEDTNGKPLLGGKGICPVISPSEPHR